MSLKQEPKYKDIANKLIDKFPTILGHIEVDKVLFLAESEKSPKKYADCRKIGWPHNYFTDYKFMIIFYENNMTGMTTAQVHMLVMHELMHIGEDFEKLRKHDVQDFFEIVATYGPGWDTDPNLVDVLDDDEDAKPMPTKNDVFEDDDEDEEPEY